MSAFHKASLIYQREYCPRTLDQDIALHAKNPTGCIIKLPELLVLARPVERNAPPDMIVNPEFCFPAGLCNCWHIYLMVGSCWSAWSLLPFELEWMSFERRNVLKVVPFRRMKAFLS